MPFAGVAVLLAWRFVAESAEGELPLDWPGAALATLALGGLTWGLTVWSSTRAFGSEAGMSIAAGALLVADSCGTSTASASAR